MTTFSTTEAFNFKTSKFCYISPAQKDLTPGTFYTLSELEKISNIPRKVIRTRIAIESKIGVFCRVVTSENLRKEGRHHKFSANLLETYGEYLSAKFLRKPL
jgi:hypothetical protein